MLYYEARVLTSAFDRFTWVTLLGRTVYTAIAWLHHVTPSYCDVLQWLRENVERLHPELWWQKIEDTTFLKQLKWLVIKVESQAVLNTLIKHYLH
jgi:hypothetical protein